MPGRSVRPLLWLALFVLPVGLPVHAGNIGEALAGCEMSDEERQLAQLMIGHPEQRRARLVCDARLQAFAMSRARDMAERDYFGHVTPERKGPNALLRDTGYEMPQEYVGGIANSVESILAGEGDPEEAWEMFMDSTPHRRHLLGEDESYARQENFGIARVHLPSSKFAYYWVVVIVENRKDERVMTCSPPPAVCIVH